MSDLIDVTCPNCGCEIHIESAQPNLQPTCNQLATDTISRQAAYDALMAEPLKWDDSSVWESARCHQWMMDMDVIKALPPAAPERKTGKWNFIGNQMFECSECGTCYTQSQFYQMRVRISDTEFPKFCPNCGADMREGHDAVN